MRVPIQLGPTPEIGLSTKLFLTHVGGAVVSARPRYMVSADGQRFLMHTVENAPAAPINVILNWKPKF